MKIARKREANFELLRVIAILMVIVLHYLLHGNLLPQVGEPLRADTVAGALIKSLCIAAVNIWVLISGYFLSDTGVSLRRLLRVVTEVLFYSITITVVMLLTGYGNELQGGLYGLVTCFLPISSEHYWFATAYVFMYLFAPLLNKGVILLSRKQLKFTIIGLLLWFCVIKSVLPVALATDDYGYGFGWFLVLYLIAAYIRKYDVRFLRSARSGLLLWSLSAILIFAVTLAVHAVNLRTGRLASWYGRQYDYNYILTLTAALGMFTAFRFLRLREGKPAELARFLAPFTFGVYLLHEHRDIRDSWVAWIEDFIGEIPRGNVAMLFLHLITSVIIVFLAGVMVDFIRRMLFEWLTRVFLNTRPGRRLRELDTATHIYRDK